MRGPFCSSASSNAGKLKLLFFIVNKWWANQSPCIVTELAARTYSSPQIEWWCTANVRLSSPAQIEWWWEVNWMMFSLVGNVMLYCSARILSWRAYGAYFIRKFYLFFFFPVNLNKMGEWKPRIISERSFSNKRSEYFSNLITVKNAVLCKQ